MEAAEAPAGMAPLPSSVPTSAERYPELEADLEALEARQNPSQEEGPLAEALRQVEGLPDASLRAPEQRRLVAYLLANREFLRYLASLVLDNLPPVVQNLIGKLLPIKAEDLWKLPIEGIWRMDATNWKTFSDFLEGAYRYGFDKSKPNT